MREDRKCARTIIFCYNKLHARKLNRELFAEFPEYDGTDAKLCPWEYFHADAPEYLKAAIIESFADPNGIVRILIATTAFGLEVNCQKTHRVIHIGPLQDVDDYLQESGRVGRDGKQSEACILLYKNYSCGRKLSPFMREYVVNKTQCQNSRQNCMKKLLVHNVLLGLGNLLAAAQKL